MYEGEILMNKTNYDTKSRTLEMEVNGCPITISFESSEPETCIWHYVFSALCESEEISVITNEVK